MNYLENIMKFRKKLKIESKKNLEETNTNDHNNKIPKEGSQFISLSAIFRTSKNQYPQVCLEEWKHVIKEKKMPEYITNSDDSDRGDSDEKNSDKENSTEENSNEEELVQNVFD